MSYKERLERSSKRLLNMGCLDLKGANYGSFDRQFWHLRQRDFSSSTYQMALLPLMRSNLSQQDELRKFFLDSLSYIKKIQNGDGSFDEWYPGERGWGGPTSYILDFISRTYLEFYPLFSNQQQKTCLEIISKAAGYISRGWERDVLYNHVALSVLALEGVRAVDKKLVSDADITYAKDWLKRYFDHAEGWGLEYDGADPGYQTATLSFLSKAHKLRADSDYKDICLKSLDFIKYFHYPDGSYAAGIGARETSCVFDFGAHYWRSHSSVAKSLSHSLIKRRCGLNEEELDDHYFVYRMLELSDCLEFDALTELDEEVTPFSKTYEGEKLFKRAQIMVKASAEHYSVINLAKGGALIEFDKQTSLCVRANYGIQVEKDGKLLSTFVNGDSLWTQSNDCLEIESPLYKVKTSSFSQTTFIFFRLILFLFSWNSKLAYILKSIIRSLLTTKNKMSGSVNKRRITWSNGRIVEVADSESSSEILGSGIFENRYVPQSKYHNDLKLKFLAKKRRGL